MAENEKLDKAQAAEYLGISPRTLLRLTGSDVAHLPKHRDSDKTFYARTELDRYLRDQESGRVTSAVVMPDTPATPAENQALTRRNGSTQLSPVTLDTGDALDTPEMRLRILAAFEAMASPVRLTDKLTLTLTEASLLSGLSRGHLREAIEAKKLKARIIGRGWKIKRDDLDLYVRKL